MCLNFYSEFCLLLFELHDEVVYALGGLNFFRTMYEKNYKSLRHEGTIKNVRSFHDIRVTDIRYKIKLCFQMKMRIKIHIDGVKNSR